MSTIRSLRFILRASTAMLLVGLVLAPVTASAEDIVLKWNDIAARTAVATSPFNQARVMAIVQLSVFEAVNAITGDYEPYLDPPTAAVAGADPSVRRRAIIAFAAAIPAAMPAVFAGPSGMAPRSRSRAVSSARVAAGK